jgi:hypothetical protein
MIRPLGALVPALLALAACDSIESIKAELFPPEQTARGDSQAGPPASVPAAAEVPPRPRRKPEAISELTLAEADPQRLVGLDFRATKALLGDPAARLEKPPAKVWAYAGGTCMFNLFFYPSVDDRVFRVLAYEVTDAPPPAAASSDGAGTAAQNRLRDKDNPKIRRCFAELLHSQQGSNAG